MSTLRSYIDPDQESPGGPTLFMTERNKREVRCGTCGRTAYVDEDTFIFFRDAIESGMDDSFRCEVCAMDYDDLAYEK